MDSTLTVLLAEDEDTDVFIMRRTIERMKLPVSLQVTSDGQETIEYLEGRGNFSDRSLHPLPAMILLDIKMPRKTGFDVLAWLKKNGTLTHIPVLMLTSSKIQRDVDRAVDLGAKAYLVKPMPFAELHHLLTKPAEFLAANTLHDTRHRPAANPTA